MLGSWNLYLKLTRDFEKIYIPDAKEVIQTRLGYVCAAGWGHRPPGGPWQAHLKEGARRHANKKKGVSVILHQAPTRK